MVGLNINLAAHREFCARGGIGSSHIFGLGSVDRLMGAGGELAFLFWNWPVSAWFFFVRVGATGGLLRTVTGCHRLSLEGFIGEMRPVVPLASIIRRWAFRFSRAQVTDGDNR